MQNLTIREREFIARMMKDPNKNERISLVLSQLLLVFGGGVIVYVIYNSLQNITDKLIYYFTVPGIGLGLIIILFSRYMKRIYDRSCDKKMFVSILQKLLD